MNRSFKSLSLGVIFLISGCSTIQPSLTTQELTQSLYQRSTDECDASLTAEQALIADQYWSSCFDHSEQAFSQVLALINRWQQASDNADLTLVENALYYLRAHYYFADFSDYSDDKWHALDNTLSQVTDKLLTLGVDNPSSFKLQERLFALVYLYYPEREAKSVLPTRLGQFNTLWQQVLSSSSFELSAQDNQYRLLEFYRMLGALSYYAVNDNTIKKALVENASLVNLLNDRIEVAISNDWQLAHQLWLAAQFYLLLDEESQQSLDKSIKAKLFDEGFVNKSDAKKLFSHLYLANSLRTYDHCNSEFSGYCDIPRIDEVLPVNHECSASVRIRATNMSQAQLNQSCQGLLEQESFFHQQINSKHTPIANDFNNQLRVVIFDNYSHYNQWGQLVFNIFTNNGGMYIEGQPDKSGNVATFYSFEAFWLQPEFDVWNLAHEYVHYLDGRFVKYGGFGHFPAQVVWWTEGLAEYISKQADNNRAFTLLNDTEAGDWPTLQQIFDTVYADGSDRVYRWSYLAQLYLFSEHIEQAQALAARLKVDDFAGYQALLSKISTTHQADFNAWLTEKLSDYQQQRALDKAVLKEKKAKQLYRYLYRDYLRPVHLPLTKSYFHFENWG